MKKINIFRVLVFFTLRYIWGQSKNFKVCWLWAAITPVRKVARPKSTSFLKSSGRELSHGCTQDMVANTKNSSNLPKSRKKAFFVPLCKNISNGRQSDNFDPRRSAYGWSESLCPKFSETPLRKSKIFKIEGVMPLQSQVIQICATQKRCFSALFLDKILFLTHFDQINPPW